MASPSSFTATTDDKGRFSIIGLKTGQWTFTAQAPSFGPESGRLNVQNHRRAQSAAHLHDEERWRLRGPAGAPGRPRAKDLQTISPAADQLVQRAEMGTTRLRSYRAIMTKRPSLSVINLQIAAAYRNKKDYDSALTALPRTAQDRSEQRQGHRRHRGMTTSRRGTSRPRKNADEGRPGAEAEP